MNKILGKGALEIVENLGPRYYSQVFLMRKLEEDGGRSSVCLHSIIMSPLLPSGWR